MRDKNNKIDVIAVSEDMQDEVIMAAKKTTKSLLSDGAFCDFGEFKSVNKYQKAEKLINEILMAYAEKTGWVEAVSNGDRKTRLLGFYSSVGGSGKTTLAVSAAYVLAARGRRVFYLNAEKINSMAALFNQAADGSMSYVYL